MSNVIVGIPSIILLGQTIKNLGLQEHCKITFPESVATLDIGYKGNVIAGRREAGRKADVDLVTIVNGDCDTVLSDWLTVWNSRDTLNNLLNMQISVQIGDGEGGLTTKVIILKGGVVNKRADASFNTEGGAEQGQRLYNLNFSYYNELNS